MSNQTNQTNQMEEIKEIIIESQIDETDLQSWIDVLESDYTRKEIEEAYNFYKRDGGYMAFESADPKSWMEA